MESSPDAITSSEEDVQPTRREETSFIYNEDTKAAELKNDKDNKDESRTGLYLYDAFNAIKKRIFPEYFKVESRALIKLGWGLSFNSFLVFFIPITMIFAVGQLGKEMLAGAGLGVSFCNLTGMVFGVGFITACDTLCSQAYGAGNYRKIGIVAQRSLLMSIICIFPIISIWINAEKILLALGQDPLIARLAAQFIECYIPALFLFIALNIMIRYLASQGIVYPSVYAVIFATVVNGICCYLFMYYFHLGVRGGAFAVDVAYLSLCLFLLLFICFRLPQMESWQGWSWECLTEWKEMVFLGVPSMAMITLEWWCFEIGIIATGMIAATEQATQIVLYHVAEIVYFISYGLSIATAVRVGNFLGSGKATQAKIALKVSIIVIIILTILMGIFIVALKDVIGYVFTKDSSVVNRTSETVSMIALVEVLDGLMAILNGGVRGVGLQKYGAGINFVGYICIATPCLLVLIFVAKLGVVGFWTGIIIGLIVQVVCFNFLLFKSDWKKLSEEAKKRSGVFRDTVSFIVADDEVEVDNIIAKDGDIVSDEKSDNVPINSTSASDIDSGNPVDSQSPENVESCEMFLANKTGMPELSSILTKLAIALLAVAVLVVGIFIRIFL